MNGSDYIEMEENKETEMNDSDYLQHIGKQDRYIEEQATEIDGMKAKIDELNARIKELEEQLKWANPGNWKPGDL
jgi:hypothetical protein